MSGPEYSLAKLIQGCVIGTAVLPDALRELIRNEWSSFSALALAIREESPDTAIVVGPSGVVNSNIANFSFSSNENPVRAVNALPVPRIAS